MINHKKVLHIIENYDIILIDKDQLSYLGCRMAQQIYYRMVWKAFPYGRYKKSPFCRSHHTATILFVFCRIWQLSHLARQGKEQKALRYSSSQKGYKALTTGIMEEI